MMFQWIVAPNGLQNSGNYMPSDTG